MGGDDRGRKEEGEGKTRRREELREDEMKAQRREEWKEMG